MRSLLLIDETLLSLERACFGAKPATRLAVFRETSREAASLITRGYADKPSLETGCIEVPLPWALLKRTVRIRFRLQWLRLLRIRSSRFRVAAPRYRPRTKLPQRADTTIHRPRDIVDLGEWDTGDDTGIPPPRGWLLGNVFARRFVSSLLGEGAVGKTAVRYAQMLSLATGRELTGERVYQRCRVLVVSLEDDIDELRRQFSRQCCITISHVRNLRAGYSYRHQDATGEHDGVERHVKTATSMPSIVEQDLIYDERQTAGFLPRIPCRRQRDASGNSSRLL